MNFTWERVITDGVVSPNPTRVGSIILTPSSATKYTSVVLYDGESTADPKILTILSGTGVTRVINFQPYLETKRGLYIDVGGDLSEVLIQLQWDKE